MISLKGLQLDKTKYICVTVTLEMEEAKEVVDRQLAIEGAVVLDHRDVLHGAFRHRLQDTGHPERGHCACEECHQINGLGRGGSRVAGRAGWC